MCYTVHRIREAFEVVNFVAATALAASEIMCKNCVVSFPGMTFDSTLTWLAQEVRPISGMRPIYIDLYEGDLTKKKSIDWKFAWQVKAESHDALSSVATAAKMHTRLSSQRRLLRWIHGTTTTITWRLPMSASSSIPNILPRQL